MEKYNLNNSEFSVSATFVENKFNAFGDNMTHPRFVVTITTDGGDRARFNYYASYNDYTKGKKDLDRNDILNAVECFLLDALSYDNSRDILDFCAEFGYDIYEDRKRARKAFEGCKKHYEAAVRLFGDEYTDILNAIQEAE